MSLFVKILAFSLILVQLSTAQAPPTNNGGSVPVCEQPMEVGKCRAAFRRWYYNTTTKECAEFIYGGCNGNQNNFFSRNQCEKTCLANVERGPHMEIGPCTQDHAPLRCTNAGYFNVIQCDIATQECFCVDPKTGTEVTSTRVVQPNPIYCPECHKSVAKALLRVVRPGVYVPECTPEGHYTSLQCHGSTGYCWCVDPVSGKEVDGTRSAPGKQQPQCDNFQDAPLEPSTTAPPPSSEAGPCHQHQATIKVMPGAYVPQCTEQGFYQLIQCHGSTGFCWCSDAVTGRELPETRIHAGQGRPQCPACHTKKFFTYQHGLPPPGAFVPQCQESGDFETLQCQGSTGECWCVDFKSGQEIAGTRRRPGQAPPNCSSSQKEKTVCEQRRDSIEPIPGAFAPRCNSDGQFELLQCHGSTGHCWCVDPESGHEIPNTRRGPGQDPPICTQPSRKSLCLLRREGIQPGIVGAFIPQCNKDGLFQMLQCHGSTGYCWCVNPFSGIELANTRMPPGQPQPDCSAILNRLDQTPQTGPRGTAVPLLPDCALPKDGGHNCAGRPQTAWYFDSVHYECLAFEYGGCGGNSNRFKDWGTCSDRCKITDGPTCVANGLPYMDPNTRESPVCNDPSECPRGYICRRGAFFGSCCNETLEKSYEKNYRPQCKSGQVQKFDAGGFQLTLIGGSCSDNFCPKGTVCEQLEFFAHCCALSSNQAQDAPAVDVIPKKLTRPEIVEPIPGIPVGSSKCYGQKVQGTDCNKRQINWYFDTDHYECLAFQYYGCDGSPNRYKTYENCVNQCKIPDGAFACAAKHSPYTKPSGQVATCTTTEQCPAGFVCRTGAFFGSCCNSTTEELYRQNYNPSCPDNRRIIQIRVDDRNSPLLGADCSDNFCPADSTCIKKEFFAYCCSDISASPTRSVPLLGDPAQQPTAVAPPQPVDMCAQPKVRGDCTADLTLNWYFDTKHLECLAFGYTGCKGNQNRFGTKPECETRCKPADGSPCVANSEPYKDPKTGEATLCSFDQDVCPAGWVCRMGAFFGSCCEQKIQELYEANYRPSCPSGAGEVLQMDMGGYMEALLGEKCEDNFCPSSTTCQQGKVFAFCCVSVGGGSRGTRRIARENQPVPPPPQNFETTASSDQSFRCLLPYDEGFVPVAMAPLNRYFYDSAANKCLMFTYYGLPPKDQNNFATAEECKEICGGDEADENNILSQLDPVIATLPPIDIKIPVCVGPKDSGVCHDHLIGLQTKMRFYYNEEKRECLAFTYSGCGGNGNNHESRNQCVQRCFPLDGSPCNGQELPAIPRNRPTLPPLPVNNGNNSFPLVPPLPPPTQLNCGNVDCPPDFECYFGMSFPVCCNKTVQEWYSSAYDKTCPDGQKTYGVDNGQYWEPIFADKCSDLQCPDGFKCNQINHLFAKCCGKEPEILASIDKLTCPFGPPLQDDTGKEIECSNNDDCPKQSNCYDANSPADPKSGHCCPIPQLPKHLLEVAIKENCTAERKGDLARCLAPFAGLTNKLTGAPNFVKIREGLLPDGEQLKVLNETCQLYSLYQQCSASVIYQPDYCYSIGHEILTDVLGFACTDNTRRILTENVECFQKKNVQLKECESHFNASLNTRSGNLDNYFDNLCQATIDAVKCIGPEVRECSAEAETLLIEFLNRMKKRLFGGNCQLPTKPPSPEIPCDNYKECLSDFTQESVFSTELGSPSNPSVIIRKEHVEKLPELCEAYSKYLYCFKDLSIDVDKDFKLGQCSHFKWHKQLQGLLGFSCHPDNLIKWLKYGDCFTALFGRSDVKVCVNTLNRLLNTNAENDTKRMCRIVDTYNGCLERPVAEECGAEALSFFRQMYKKAKAEAFDGCKINDEVTHLEISLNGDVVHLSSAGINCQMRRNAIQAGNSIRIGQYVPQCQSNGDYMPVQCHGSLGQCWCVDVNSGLELESTRAPPGQRPICGACHQARQLALSSGTRPVPQCSDDGLFHPIQCDMTNGSCWCAKPTSGRAIEGTLVQPGDPLPTCGLKDVFSCDRLPWRETCKPNGTKPQVVFRWYRDGNKCKAYRYPYCSSESHLPPYPMRKKQDCIKLCLSGKTI